MNGYQQKMAQVLKTQTAINALAHELWLLKMMENTEFGNGQIDRAVDGLFEKMVEINETIYKDIFVAHWG